MSTLLSFDQLIYLHNQDIEHHFPRKLPWTPFYLALTPPLGLFGSHDLKFIVSSNGGFPGLFMRKHSLVFLVPGILHPIPTLNAQQIAHQLLLTHFQFNHHLFSHLKVCLVIVD